MGAALLQQTTLATGDGWALRKVVCTAQAGERPFEEAHDAHVIAWVTQGSFTYHGAERRQLLHNGAVLLAHKGQCYSCGHRHDGGDTCIALQVDDDVFDALAFWHTGTVGFQFPTTHIVVPQFLETGFLSVMHACDARDERVSAVLGDVMRLLAGVSGKSETRLADEIRVEKTLRHIEHHLSDPLDLDTLAMAAGLSKFHYLRVFKTVTGTTPYNHVLALRLRAAAAMLCSTRAPVAEVALACGFGDLSTFMRSFKARYGKSPAAFRQRGF